VEVRGGGGGRGGVEQNVLFNLFCIGYYIIFCL